MKIFTIMLAIVCLSLTAAAQSTVSPGLYKEMSRAERIDFVREQARRIAREISGNEYEFTAAFELDIQKHVSWYAERIGPSGENSAKRDLRLVVERGQARAPLLNSIFRSRNVSPLLGLYVPWIESEFMNLEASGPMGAIGMYQFLPSTGERFGLSREDLLDVAKSADAAARYITQNTELFKHDPMKEALALLAYNRGEDRTARDLKTLLNNENNRCSICALTAGRSKLDETFRTESVFYVPRFFAAAIIGENPQAFGLQSQPLSSF
jgi:membrane-bound lytic murein transglycosylase D